MPKHPTYDVVVIGSGSAGFSAAFAAKAQGASVCIVEKEKLGGECPNWACVPTKALLKAAKAYRQTQDVADFGVRTGKVKHSFKDMMAYRRNVVEKITGGGERGSRYLRLSKQQDIDLAFGEAQFVDEHTLKVNGGKIKGKTFVVATGTTDFIPPISGLDSVPFWGWKDINTLKKQPRSIAIVGAGPVGCEIATFFASIGTRVVLIQASPIILDREDLEIAELAQEHLKKQGVEIYTKAKLVQVHHGRRRYMLEVKTGRSTETLRTDALLIATGKRANTDGLGLEVVGVNLTKRGDVEVNTGQRTNLSHIFAAGDVSGGMRFTHTAHHEGTVAGNNAALKAKKKRKGLQTVDMKVVPRVTFIEPELASVGMTAEEAKEEYGQIIVGRYPIAALGRAVTEHSTSGRVKIIAHPKTKRIVGACILSDRAGEMIHELALAIYANVKIDKLGSMMHAFPTYSEAIVAAANNIQVE